MPELPEVETVRRSLRPLIGRRIVSARLRRVDICTTADGGRARPADLLVGATIVELSRLGKRLAIIARDGRTIVIHLGMSGQLRLLATGEARVRESHVHAEWQTDEGSVMYFRDPRRFGGLWTLPDRDALDEHWSDLGPDALRIRWEDLAAAAGRSRRAIKAALLDQAVLAGVGNIYADEALFLAGIRPTRLASRLKPQEWQQLAAAVRTTLKDAIRARGSTLRDYRDAAGNSGRAQLRHAVYGRAGEACTVCGNTLRRITLAQRTTVFCTDCQR